jgi:hypothetical protein
LKFRGKSLSLQTRKSKLATIKDDEHAEDDDDDFKRD